jgi:hypothetical protein
MFVHLKPVAVKSASARLQYIISLLYVKDSLTTLPACLCPPLKRHI